MENENSNEVEALTRTIEAQRDTITGLEAQLEGLKENYQAHKERHEERVEALSTALREARETDAYAERTARERAEISRDQWKQEAERAQREREQLRQSVTDQGPLDPNDPRLAHIWEKAHRIATHAGFCSEYERIAEALGVPTDHEADYSGTVDVYVSGFTVSVPVSGSAYISEIKNGDIDPHVEWSDIVEAMSEFGYREIPSWEIQDISDISLDD